MKFLAKGKAKKDNKDKDKDKEDEDGKAADPDSVVMSSSRKRSRAGKMPLNPPSQLAAASCVNNIIRYIVIVCIYALIVVDFLKIIVA